MFNNYHLPHWMDGDKTMRAKLCHCFPICITLKSILHETSEDHVYMSRSG